MTDSDAKEWVTVKLPKEVRDDAQDDPRTYGEIMRAGLDSEKSPAKNVNMDFSDIDPAKLPGDVPDDLQDRLDRIESAAKEATNAAQSAEHAIEGLQK